MGQVQLADSFGNVATLTHKSKVLDDWCAEVGRDPAEIERSTGVRRDPGSVADELLDIGVTLFTIGVSGPAYDLGLVRDWVAWRDDQVRGAPNPP